MHIAQLSLILLLELTKNFHKTALKGAVFLCYNLLMMIKFYKGSLTKLNNAVVLTLLCAIFFSLINVSNVQALTVNPRLEIDSDPGKVVSTSLKIINEERVTRTFYIRSENFNSQDETGNPSFTSRKEGLATWIKAPLSVTLGPSETINLPIEIAIPIKFEVITSKPKPMVGS